jgi:FeS assembly SUF system regulator
MFRLNRLTDYAVVVMAQMATRPGVTTAAQVARDTGVPPPTVAKLMTALARAGLASSQRGVAGGYTLSRPAAAISVAEVIAAIEGPIALTACVDDASEHCDVESICPMRGNWNKVNRAIRRALEELSLADMMPAPWTPLVPPGGASPERRLSDAS